MDIIEIDLGGANLHMNDSKLIFYTHCQVHINLM